MMYMVELLDEDTLDCLYEGGPFDLDEARLVMARLTSRIRPGEYLRLSAPDAYEDDGQPDEAQEWYDYDPDC
tara:strand:- start:249 stop:464 length:216 start_codon:yes stop_codon:yes gene_type:complete